MRVCVCDRNRLDDVANIARKGLEKAGYEIMARVMGAAFKIFDWIKDNLALEIKFAGQVVHSDMRERWAWATKILSNFLTHLECCCSFFPFFSWFFFF